jgi:glycerate dehydrogenase
MVASIACWLIAMNGLALPEQTWLGWRMKIVVLDAATLAFEESAWEDFRRIGELSLYDRTAASADAIVERVSSAEVVFTNKVPLSAEVLVRCPQLKFIGVLATGYNIIDLDAARERGVTVCNVPGYATETTAQHAVALALELCNRVALHSDSVHRGDWVRSKLFSYWKQAPRELASMTVGIVGFGSIGRIVGATLHAMGATIRASARRERNTPDWARFAWASNETIFETCDLISLHCPQTPENTGFVNHELLARVKPGALLVNTARGGLVDEAALAEALRKGPIGGAALDVVTTEPMLEDCPLRGAPNCFITPHIAWASEAARLRLLNASLHNLRSFLAGTPVNVL